MVRYNLIKGSEINCRVYMEENGLIDVTPIDPYSPYSFTYEEYYPNGESEVYHWDSQDEIKDYLDRLSEVPSESCDHDLDIFDSNLKSSF